MNCRFQPGDHLQVRRPSLYYHHGIYISDGRVIQFGSGVSLMNKRGVGINAVSLKDFEKGGTAIVVVTGTTAGSPAGIRQPTGHGRSWSAEFLLKLQPRLPYHLIGHNCEVIANMCASGGWTESYQVRRYFTVRTFVDAALGLWIAIRVRAKLSLPGWVLLVVAAGALASIGVKFTYDDQISRFWNEIRSDWQAHERMLAEDPRDGR